MRLLPSLEASPFPFVSFCGWLTPNGLSVFSTKKRAGGFSFRFWPGSLRHPPQAASHDARRVKFPWAVRVSPLRRLGSAVQLPARRFRLSSRFAEKGQPSSSTGPGRHGPPHSEVPCRVATALGPSAERSHNQAKRDQHAPGSEAQCCIQRRAHRLPCGHPGGARAATPHLSATRPTASIPWHGRRRMGHS